MLQFAVLELTSFFVQKSRTFVYDPEKEKRAKEAAERKKREEGKRKAYEQRMVKQNMVEKEKSFGSCDLIFFMLVACFLKVRKAKREGLDPQHFLSAAALKPPSVADVAAVRASGDEQAQLAAWRSRFPQHCFAYHLGALQPNGTGGCARDRTCAFLHCDAVGNDDNGNDAQAVSWRFDAAPSWLEEKGA